MAQLSLVVAQAIKPALAASQVSLRQMERFAERSGLPPRSVFEPAGFVPLHATENFLNLLQRQTGDPTFLFKSLGLDPQERQQTHSVVGIPLPVGMTGAEALLGVTATFNTFITGARYLCETRGEFLWIMRTTGATEWSDAWPVLQYNIGIMLFASRRILGRDVGPRAIMLPVRPAASELPDDLRDLPLVQNTSRFGLAFRLSDIAALKFTLAAPRKPDLPPQAMPIRGVSRRSVGDCISRFLMSPTTDCLSERVAKGFGMSSRSYRRHLSDIGTTHARLLADVRLELAFELLADSSCTVTSVAIELGYQYPGDFTRFFKARTGISPAEYRRTATPATPATQ